MREENIARKRIYIPERNRRTFKKFGRRIDSDRERQKRLVIFIKEKQIVMLLKL